MDDNRAVFTIRRGCGEYFSCGPDHPRQQFRCSKIEKRLYSNLVIFVGVCAQYYLHFRVYENWVRTFAIFNLRTAFRVFPRKNGECSASFARSTNRFLQTNKYRFYCHQMIMRQLFGVNRAFTEKSMHLQRNYPFYLALGESASCATKINRLRANLEGISEGAHA